MNRMKWLVAAMACVVLAGLYADDLHYWGGVNGVYDGLFTDATHWSLNGQKKVPDVGARAYIGYNVNKSYTVTMPDGVYTNFAKFAPVVNPGYAVTIDGSNSVLVHPENTQGTYNTDPFCLFYNSLNANMMTFSVSGATPNPTTSPHLVFSNYLFRISSAKAGSVKTEFEKGIYNFDDPCGQVWTSPANPTTYFFGHNSNGTAMDLDEIVFGKDVVYKGAKRSIFYGNATTNILCIHGQATFGTTWFPALPNGEGVNTGATFTELAADGEGAAVDLVGDAALGYTAKTAAHTYRLVARNGGRLTMRGSTVTYGKHELCADGGTFVFGPGNQSYHLNTSYQALHVTAKNGGTLLMDHQGGGLGLYLGKTGADGMGLGLVSVTNATLRLNGGGKCNLYNGKAVFGEGAVVDVGGSLNFSGNVSGPIDVVFDGATLTNRSVLSFGGTGQANTTIRDSSLYLVSGGTASGVQQEDATVDYYDSKTMIPSGGKWFVGYTAGKSATLNVYSGTIDVAEKSDNQLEIGWLGTGRLNVYGGTVNVGRLRISSTSGSGTVTSAENVLDIEGGLVNVREDGSGSGVCANNNANRLSRMILNGGVLRCYRIYTAAGTTYLEADGGTLQANNDSERMVRDLTGLTVGAKGLTIDNDGHAIDFDIAFADKPTANGFGRVILKGAGSTKFTGSMADVGYLVAEEGTVNLSALPSDGLGSLVATNTAVLKLDPSKTIPLAGTLELKNLRVQFTSDVTLDETHDLFSYKTAMSAASREGLADALAIGGVAAGATVVFDEVATDGGYVLRAAVRAEVTTDIVATSTETKTADVLYRAADKAVATVSGGAELTLSGKVGTGLLEKTGAGTLVLSNQDNRFLRGVSLLDGRLTVSDPLALGLGQVNNGKVQLRNGVLRFAGDPDTDYADLFEFAQVADTDHVILDAQVNAKMAVPPSLNNAGGVTKRGPGRVTFEVEGDNLLVDGNGTHDVSKGFWSERYALVYPQLFDGTTGLMTNGTFGALNINEGELRFIGKGDGAKVSRLGAVCLALPTTGGSAMPGLWLDNVQLYNATGARYFFIASCLDYSTPVVADFADEPYLVLTNGASLKVGTLFCNRLNNNSQQRTKIDVSSGSSIEASAVHPNRAQTTAVKATWNFRDSALLTTSVSLFRDFTMNFDASVLAKNADLDPMKFVTEVASVGSSTCTVSFRNGSTFACSAMTPPTASMASYHPITFVFDDSKWAPAKDADFTFNFTPAEKFLFAVTNAGLVLDVPATRTWTFENAITGTGGIVKQGAGTLALGSGAVAYSGVTRVDEGVLDLGGHTQSIRVAGPGTVSNGTVENGGLVLTMGDDGTVTGGVSVLANVVFAGRTKVDLGRTGAMTPLTRPYKTVTVATYTGTAPDVSSWRITGKGQTNLSAEFVAKDGVVTMTPTDNGMMIIVR